MGARKIFGELGNRLAERTEQVHPQADMPATIMLYTDRLAATVVSLDLSGMGDIKAIFVREDKSIPASDGTYTYERDVSKPMECYTLRKNGCWVRKGQKSSDGVAVVLGRRETYFDPSF